MLNLSNRTWWIILVVAIAGVIVRIVIYHVWAMIAVQCIQSEVKAGEVSLPVALVRRVDLALNLEVPDGACATVTKLKFSRENGKLNCLVFANRGSRALSVDGLQGISRKPAPNYDKENGACPQNGPVRSGDITAMISSTDRGTKLSFSSYDAKSGKFTDYGEADVGEYNSVEGFGVNGYRYAGILKNKRGIYVGVLVLDMEKYKPVASVDIPSDLFGQQPQCLVDAKTNALVVLDNALQWMHIIDLQPLVDHDKTAESKPASKPQAETK